MNKVLPVLKVYKVLPVLKVYRVILVFVEILVLEEKRVK